MDDKTTSTPTTPIDLNMDPKLTTPAAPVTTPPPPPPATTPSDLPPLSPSESSVPPTTPASPLAENPDEVKAPGQ